MTTIPLPATASAAQSNRQIQVWLEELEAPVTGHHRAQDLRQAIEALYLRSLNQIRATKKKPVRLTGPSYFNQRPVTIPVRPSGKHWAIDPWQTSKPRVSDIPVINTEKVIQLHVDTDRVVKLQEAQTALSFLTDRSSPEARKLRKQIRDLKDYLGIPR